MALAGPRRATIRAGMHCLQRCISSDLRRYARYPLHGPLGDVYLGSAFCSSRCGRRSRLRQWAAALVAPRCGWGWSPDEGRPAGTSSWRKRALCCAEPVFEADDASSQRIARSEQGAGVRQNSAPTDVLEIHWWIQATTPASKETTTIKRISEKLISIGTKLLILLCCNRLGNRRFFFRDDVSFHARQKIINESGGSYAVPSCA